MIEINADIGISSISAGFPSPADDFTELTISLDKHLIQNPAATFMAYANGNSMLHAGIHHGDIIIAVLHGEFTVKQLSIIDDTLLLIPQNPQYSPIQVSSEMDFEVWGIVTYSIRKHR